MQMLLHRVHSNLPCYFQVQHHSYCLCRFCLRNNLKSCSTPNFWQFNFLPEKHIQSRLLRLTSPAEWCTDTDILRLTDQIVVDRILTVPLEYLKSRINFKPLLPRSIELLPKTASRSLIAFRWFLLTSFHLSSCLPLIMLHSSSWALWITVLVYHLLLIRYSRYGLHWLYVSAGIKGQRMDRVRMVEETVFMGNGWG